VLLQVNRLELTLSMAGFAAGIGPMIAGIFGMNLRSTLEESVIGVPQEQLCLVASGSLLPCIDTHADGGFCDTKKTFEKLVCIA
jgi:hypothetical protein